MKLVYSGLHNGVKVSGEIERKSFLSPVTAASDIFFQLTNRKLSRCRNWNCFSKEFETKSGKELVSIKFAIYKS